MSDAIAARNRILLVLFIISTPVMARLSDLRGRRFIYTVDVFLFGAGSLPGAVIASHGSRFEGYVRGYQYVALVSALMVAIALNFTPGRTKDVRELECARREGR